jgi:SAM-dependent methyltransferase
MLLKNKNAVIYGGGGAIGAARSDRYGLGMLGHGVPTERLRLQLMERLHDPQTIGIFERLGIRLSWRCLELGAGAGSIARWLAARCPDGRVVATDADTRFLDSSRAQNLEVLRHDVVGEDLPHGPFDLVHARALMIHLPEREAVLARAATRLAPGGWLVVEEPALFPHDSSPYPAFRRLMDAFEGFMANSQEAEVRWARGLPAALAGAGLEEVGASVSLDHVGDGGPGEEFWRAFLNQLRPALTGSGLIGEAGFEAGMAVFDDPSFVDVAGAMVSAWGRSPAPGVQRRPEDR